MKELENKLKELKEEHINVSDLEILEEIDYQSKYYLEIELTDKEKEKLFSMIHRAWIKSEDLTIYQITTAAMDNLDHIGEMSTWDLVEEACYV